jgi:hypothetical protein
MPAATKGNLAADKHVVSGRMSQTKYAAKLNINWKIKFLKT